MLLSFFGLTLFFRSILLLPIGWLLWAFIVMIVEIIHYFIVERFFYHRYLTWRGVITHSILNILLFVFFMSMMLLALLSQFPEGN